MTPSTEITDIFTMRDPFLQRVKERIWGHPCDFTDTWLKLQSPLNKRDRRLAAGVLMPLIFRESPSDSSGKTGSFVILLIKRSQTVAQAGDLSFPGGMVNPVGDRILRYLLLYRLLPVIRQKAKGVSPAGKHLSSRLTTLFMTTALRESWEEIGLSPFRTALIGSLPTYNLTYFQKTIFPVAGFVENNGLFRPNGEVEKIMEIPLSSFYNQECLGSLQIAPSTPCAPAMEYPCLIHTGNDGKQEVLWGATFYIIVEFLRIVMDYHLPETRKGPVIARELSSNYLSRNPST